MTLALAFKKQERAEILYSVSVRDSSSLGFKGMNSGYQASNLIRSCVPISLVLIEKVG